MVLQPIVWGWRSLSLASQRGFLCRSLLEGNKRGWSGLSPHREPSAASAKPFLSLGRAHRFQLLGMSHKQGPLRKGELWIPNLDRSGEERFICPACFINNPESSSFVFMLLGWTCAGTSAEGLGQPWPRRPGPGQAFECKATQQDQSKEQVLWLHGMGVLGGPSCSSASWILAKHILHPCCVSQHCQGKHQQHPLCRCWLHPE